MFLKIAGLLFRSLLRLAALTCVAVFWTAMVLFYLQHQQGLQAVQDVQGATALFQQAPSFLQVHEQIPALTEPFWVYLAWWWGATVFLSLILAMALRRSPLVWLCPSILLPFLVPLFLALLRSRPRDGTAPSSPASGSLVNRARAALARQQVDEKKLAADESYRNSKLREFAEIIAVAKEACRSAGHAQAVPQLATIEVGGSLLMAAWAGLRPQLEATPTALFAYSVMIVACWSTPQGAIRQFALGEAKPGDTVQTMLQLVSTTASSLKQMVGKLGLPI